MDSSDCKFPKNPTGTYTYIEEECKYIYNEEPGICISYKARGPGTPIFRLQWGERYVFFKAILGVEKNQHGETEVSWEITSVNFQPRDEKSQGYKDAEEMMRAISLMQHFLWQCHPSKFPSKIVKVEIAEFLCDKIFGE